MADVVPAGLAEVAGAIKLLSRETGKNLIFIGGHLLAARRLLPPDRFGPWVAETFGWHPAYAARMMRVAEHFAGTPTERFDPAALLALAAPTAPPQARRLAVARAAGGHRVTAAHARDLIAAARPAASSGKSAGRAARVHPTDRPEPEDRTLELLAWRAVEGLVAEGSAVRVGRLGGADDDDPAGRPYTCAVEPPGGPPRVSVSKDSAASAVTLAAGVQPPRTCKECGETHPVFDGFSRKTGNPLGRSFHCRKCETRRVGDSKKLRRGTAKPDDFQPPNPPRPADRGKPADADRP